MTPNIAIVGGGLSGRLTAMQLAERGFSVTLFDKGGRAGENAAAYVAAAMLAPAAEAADATPEAILLGEKSVALWRGIIGYGDRTGRLVAHIRPSAGVGGWMRYWRRYECPGPQRRRLS